MSQFVQAAFFVSPNFQYQYEKPFAAKKCYFSRNCQCESSSLEIFHFGVCKLGEAVNHFTLKVFFLVSLKNVGKKTSQYDQSPLFFCAPFKIVVVVVVVVVVGLVVWGRLGAASAVLETCGAGQGALTTTLDGSMGGRTFDKYFLHHF